VACHRALGQLAQRRPDEEAVPGLRIVGLTIGVGAAPQAGERPGAHHAAHCALVVPGRAQVGRALNPLRHASSVR
jgi:hypothetical protein